MNLILDSRQVAASPYLQMQITRINNPGASPAMLRAHFAVTQTAAAERAEEKQWSHDLVQRVERRDGREFPLPRRSFRQRLGKLIQGS